MFTGVFLPVPWKPGASLERTDACQGGREGKEAFSGKKSLVPFEKIIAMCRKAKPIAPRDDGKGKPSSND